MLGFDFLLVFPIVSDLKMVAYTGYCLAYTPLAHYIKGSFLVTQGRKNGEKAHLNVFSGVQDSFFF